MTAPRNRRRLRVVSGGQTGVDRAALDAALDLGFPCGGWCPRGRPAEDGRIAERYPLQEAETSDYAERTRLNVLDSDATLILAPRPLRGGTLLTERVAVDHGRPVFVCDPAVEPPEPLLAAIVETPIRTLNVAGPRESGRPGVYAEADAFVRRLLGRLS